MKNFVLSLLGGSKPLPLPMTLRASFGALFGIIITALSARALIDGAFSLAPLLIAPIGASAVLLFAIPASPLAQPRSVIGGNVISAVIGVLCALFIPMPLGAAAVAVCGAILVMSLAGCLHPPGGAVALGAVLAGASGTAPAAMYAMTVTLCSLLLVATAIVYARMTRVAYPHPAVPAKVHGTQDPAPTERVGFTPADLDAALAEYGKLLDVSCEDLDALFRRVELQAHRRLHARIRCGEIMSRDIVMVDHSLAADKALSILQQHDLRTAPVVDDGRRVIGLARRAELAAAGSAPVRTAVEVHVHRVGRDTPIEALLPLLSSGTTHEVMVVDGAGVLIGLVTQTDLLAVLYRAHIVEALAVAA